MTTIILVFIIGYLGYLLGWLHAWHQIRRAQWELIKAGRK